MAPLQRHPIYKNSNLNVDDIARINAIAENIAREIVADAMARHVADGQRYGRYGMAMLSVCCLVAGLVGYLLGG